LIDKLDTLSAYGEAKVYLDFISSRYCYPPESVLYDHIIDVSEYSRGNKKWKIQRNWQHRAHKTKKNKTKPQHKTICVGHDYAQANTNNVNRT
jgi:hypothetical protein